MSAQMTEKQTKKKMFMIHGFIKVFSELGLDGAYVRRLAKGVGATEGLVYKYFENKDDVIRQCTIYYHELTQKELTEVVIKYINSPDLLSKMLLDYVESVVDVCRFLLQVMAHPTYSSIMKQTENVIDSCILSWADNIQKTYILSEREAESAAFYLNSIINDYILKKSKSRFMLQFDGFKKLVGAS